MIIGIDIGSTTTKAVSLEEGKITKKLKTRAEDAVTSATGAFGKMIRIKNEGVPVSGRRGDLYFKLMVQIPTKLSRRGRELMEELSTVEGENSSPKPIPLSELVKQ